MTQSTTTVPIFCEDALVTIVACGALEHEIHGRMGCPPVPAWT